VRLLAALAVAACALVSGAADATPSELTPAEQTRLLEAYTPVLSFAAGENWSPTAVDVFIRRARLERQVARNRWQRRSGPLPTSSRGCALSPCFRLNLPCRLRRGVGCYETQAPKLTDWSRGTVYGRVVDVPAGTPPPPGIGESPKYLVRYWLFYYFDDWRSLHARLWQAHEADWESVTVGLREDLSPLFAAYSEHCTGSVRPWDRVPAEGTHPIDFVALGSHANYFEKGRHGTDFADCLRAYGGSTVARRLVRLAKDVTADRTGSAHVLRPEQLQVVDLPDPLPRWARFPGRWSEPQLLWLGRTPRRLTTLTQGLGPATPRWTGATVPSFWHSGSS
jgi:hypothetical protein